MYRKKCKYCGKEFESTQPTTKYCGKYHAGKARTERKEAKKNKITYLNRCWKEVRELTNGSN
ncbi:hypothetical protein NSA42_17700 [Paeniclostridium sordellii]|uniref:hypothetical protein n=1 Tax=Paraclostridium sordellii TaxID=1505 RepID=UPI002149C6E6|nr:hypothetical protein [Paeniclostridium sordellii]MCR1851112.1 hypothetical protein [Paeniclostridium sordellii]